MNRITKVTRRDIFDTIRTSESLNASLIAMPADNFVGMAYCHLKEEKEILSVLQFTGTRFTHGGYCL
jgi:hypothetical protein